MKNSEDVTQRARESPERRLLQTVIPISRRMSFKQRREKQSVAAHTFSPHTREAEADGALGVPGQPGLHTLKNKQITITTTELGEICSNSLP